MRIFRTVSALLSHLIVWAPLFSQNVYWNHYGNGTFVNTLALENDTIWAGTTSGLYKFGISNYTVLHYSRTYTDMSYNRINAILTDGPGIKWIGTADGLNHWDGTNWTVYNTSNSIMPSSCVKLMRKDSSGVIWIVPDSGSLGLLRIDGASWTLLDSSAGMPVGQINDAQIDRNNKKWISFQKDFSYSSLLVYDDTTWTFIDSTNSNIPEGEPGPMVIDTTGKKWMVFDRLTLASYNDTTWTVYDSTNSGLALVTGPCNYISSICVDRSNHILIGIDYNCGNGAGFLEFDGVAWVLHDLTGFGYPQNANSLLCIAADQNNNYFAGTEYGVIRYDGFTTDLYTNDSIILSDQVNSITQDLTGNIWVGTSQGLSKFNGTAWTNYNTQNSGLPSNYIDDILIDANNNIWLTADSFLVSYDGTIWTVFSTANSGLPPNRLSKLAMDSNILYIGSYNSGVTRYDGSSWTKMDTSNSSIASNSIRDMFIDSSGTLWIIHMIGQYYFSALNDSAWASYTYSDIGQPGTPSMFFSGNVDNNGLKWFGGSNGILSFNDTSWILYNNFNIGFYTGNIWGIAADSSNHIWFAATEEFIEYDGTVWNAYNVNNSEAPCDYWISMLIDNFENKWIGSGNCGLAVFNGNGIITGINKDKMHPAGRSNVMFQSRPNPFSTGISLSYSLPSAGTVSLTVTDLLGRLTINLADAHQSAGNHTLWWNGSSNGVPLPQGIYYCILKLNGKPVASGKLVKAG